jgi:CBS domain-containing protein
VLRRIGFDSRLDAGALVGIIVYRDLRLSERYGSYTLEPTAAEIMNPQIRSAFAANALALMEERGIASLIVSGIKGIPLGVEHFHNLWTLEMI